ncbi:MAG TPA: sensor histidine kinase [Pyrinomonadaceae bacterium]|nr:sensor histidine kinase [Pyrinomonadaceae bacterium]
MFPYGPRAAAAASVLVGCAVTAGWLFGVKFLTGVLPGLPVMVPNTALSFVLAGASLWLVAPGAGPGATARDSAARLCALAVLALGSLTLLEYALGLDLRIDGLLPSGRIEAGAATFPGRMSPHTALNFCLSGAALYCLGRAPGRRRVLAAQALAVATGMVALLALVGYTYSITALYSITPQTGMAVHTALTFGVLSAGVLLCRPREGPVAVFTSAGAGGVVARPLLAAAVLVPLLLGWLTALGQRAGFYEQALASSLLVVGSVVAFSALVWQSARLLDRLDAERQAAEGARTELLRRLVVAQEEERARLSRELHDKMGQHLSALALNLELHRESTGPGAPKGGLIDRLSELAEELSTEVRALAWELRPPEMDGLGLRDALASYAEQWSRRSGIPVDFVSTGDEQTRLPHEAETAIYRVCQEALTNVLKHSGASGATVLFERSPGQAVLVVEDDGCGFDAHSLAAAHGERRRLGLLGMKERVELAGGSLTIESAPGAGATVVARVMNVGEGESGGGGPA